MRNFRKEYCIEKGLNYIKPKNYSMNDYIVHLENKLEQAINFTSSSTELPSKEEMDSMLSDLIVNNFESDEYSGKKEYGFGFRACYRWIVKDLKRK